MGKVFNSATDTVENFWRNPAAYGSRQRGRRKPVEQPIEGGPVDAGDMHVYMLHTSALYEADNASRSYTDPAVAFDAGERAVVLLGSLFYLDSAAKKMDVYVQVSGSVGDWQPYVDGGVYHTDAVGDTISVYKLLSGSAIGGFSTGDSFRTHTEMSGTWAYGIAALTWSGSGTRADSFHVYVLRSQSTSVTLPHTGSAVTPTSGSKMVGMLRTSHSTNTGSNLLVRVERSGSDTGGAWVEYMRFLPISGGAVYYDKLVQIASASSAGDFTAGDSFRVVASGTGFWFNAAIYTW